MNKIKQQFAAAAVVSTLFLSVTPSLAVAQSVSKDQVVTTQSVSLAQAQAMAKACEVKAKEIGVPMIIAIVDAG